MSRRYGLGVVAILAVSGLIGVACGGGGKGSTALSGPAARPATTGGDGAEHPAAAPTPVFGGAFQLTAIGPRIIKTATVSLDIRRGTFEGRVQEATLVAARHGGFVSSSRTIEGKFVSGTIILRVPASQFETALAELKALGKVSSEQISGADVTAQFVDLQARLRNWEAQEGVLLRLMSKSTSIDESLKVQRALQDVQLAIEEIRGQLRVLSDQTDLSTITLSLAERAPVALPHKPNPFVRSWRAGLHGTLAVLTAIVIGFGYLVPVLAIALIAGLGWLVFRRTRAKPEPATVGQDT